jgi:hypothetical protein
MNRLCTVPGCQSRHHSHGFCNAHRHHWRKYGDPTAGRQRAEAVEPRDVEQMLALAADGLGRMDIAACTGWSVQTVGRHVGHAVPARHTNRQPDVARYRRMLKATAVAEYGTQGDLAGRFGLTPRSFKTTLVTARRRVKEFDAALSEADKG